MAGLSWAEIEADLLILLAERLTGVTSFIRFSAVCKLWHTIASVAKCSNPVPWLMLVGKEDSEFRTFFDLCNGEVYRYPLSQVPGTKIVGADHGWLITYDDDLHLLNPLTGTQIDFPSLPMHDISTSFGSNVTEKSKAMPRKATCSPVGPDGDRIVAVIHTALTGIMLPIFSFCRLSDKKWSEISHPFCTLLHDVCYAGGAFYVLTLRLNVWHCDLSANDPIFTKISDLPTELINRSFRGGFFVECDIEILFVVKVKVKGQPVRFRVFKVDIEGDEKLKEISSIGNFALLMAPNNSISIPTSMNLGHSFKSNCIYFRDYKKDNIGEFCLEDGSITLHRLGVLELHDSFCGWITVNPAELITLSIS